MKIVKTLVILISVFLCFQSYAARNNILFREEFKNLDNWEPFYFPKIKKHSSYKPIAEGHHTYLKAESDASASALICKKTFNVYNYPRIRWRWKIDNVYVKARTGIKAGDDYPIRVYVNFQYDPGTAGLSERLTYAAAKALYGHYPPHSTLNYVWASREDDAEITPSPYTDRAMIIVLEKGQAKIGKWVDEEADIIQDYQRAFGKKPPPVARIAVMNDSDNTQERSTSYLEFIEVFK
jgi:hypothetical protein